VDTSGRPCVSSSIRPGREARGDRGPAAELDRLVDARGGTPDADRIRVLGREGIDLGEYPEAGLQVVGVDRGHP
jgi:hypothetical protein